MIRLKIITEGQTEESFGSQIAKRISLGPMREKCPHFNSWISELEELSRGEPI